MVDDSNSALFLRSANRRRNTWPAPDSKFVHLHVHSDYSLLDGANRIDRLMDRAKELGMSSLALTDHGNLFGAIDFYNTAKARGIKPLIGCESYLAEHRCARNAARVRAHLSRADPRVAD